MQANATDVLEPQLSAQNGDYGSTRSKNHFMKGRDARAMIRNATGSLRTIKSNSSLSMPPFLSQNPRGFPQDVSAKDRSGNAGKGETAPRLHPFAMAVAEFGSAANSKDHCAGRCVVA